MHTEVPGWVQQHQAKLGSEADEANGHRLGQITSLPYLQ